MSESATIDRDPPRRRSESADIEVDPESNEFRDVVDGRLGPAPIVASAVGRAPAVSGAVSVDDERVRLCEFAQLIITEAHVGVDTLVDRVPVALMSYEEPVRPAVTLPLEHRLVARRTCQRRIRLVPIEHRDLNRLAAGGRAGAGRVIQGTRPPFAGNPSLIGDAVDRDRPFRRSTGNALDKRWAFDIESICD